MHGNSPEIFRRYSYSIIFVNETRHTLVSSKEHLGYIISNSDRDDLAIQKECIPVYARGNMLLRKFKSCSADVKKQLFISCCSSSYCCALWSNFKKTSLQELQVAYNNILKLLMKLPYQCRVSPHFMVLGLKHFSVIKRKTIYSLYQHLLLRSNT